jgi:hypothetical protein
MKSTHETAFFAANDVIKIRHVRIIEGAVESDEYAEEVFP